MDITLIKTFLEVAATGSFGGASDRLFVTQSAVSLRIQRLEASLGHRLFVRSKAGAVLTPPGVQFEKYALSLIKIWEEARQQIAIPDGFSRSLVIGAQYSLWPRLGFRWLDALQVQMPDLSLRAETGMPERLTRFLIEGVIQIGLMYTPQLRPGLIAEPLADDELILVASWEGATMDIADDYVFVDWGPEFTHAHAIGLPHLNNSGLTMVLGTLGAEYIVNRKKAAYLPARGVQRHIDAKKLFPVPDAPRFPYPVWSVWRDDLEPELAASAKQCLMSIVDQIRTEQDVILTRLAETSEDNSIGELGRKP